MRNLKYLLLSALLLGMFSSWALGQDTATLLGTVTDPSGRVVPNVTVTITHHATGLAKTSSTNDVGQYVFPDVQIGNYDLKAAAKGFKAHETKGVVLNASDRVRMDFQMAVGANSETVTVEATPLNVQTDSGEQSSLVNGKQITELATKNRTIYSYAMLTTGAANLNPDTQVPVPVGGASGNISFNGNRPGHNLYMLDGGENSDRGGAGSSSILPSLDAIAQTQVLTSNYSAEYGLSSGGTISSVTKSGTNQYHASGWEFFQNDALQAKNYFNSKKGEFRYNVFGFNIGGPVPGLKDKLFFFYNQEWRRLINGTNINQHVPDPATYGGNFGSTSIIMPSGVDTSYTARNCPGGVLPAGVTPGQNFPNNIIPACMLDPNAQALLTSGGKFGGIFPAPNNGTNFTAPVSLPNNLREEITRIDYNATSKLSIYGSFVAESVAQNIATSMWSNDNVPSVGNTFGNPSYDSRWDVAAARESGVIPSFLQPLDKPVPMVATADVGRVAAELLQGLWNGRRVVELEGPRRVTPDEIADTFAELIGRPVRMNAVPRETWEPLFRSQGMKNPTPRVRMLDGFNEGWIEFENGEASPRKGEVALKTVLQMLIERERN